MATTPDVPEFVRRASVPGRLRKPDQGDPSVTTDSASGDSASRDAGSSNQGVVKTYDPETGVGVLVTDAGDEIYLRPGSLDGSIFRFVRQGQRIVFELADDDNQQFAIKVRMGQEGY